MAFNTRGINVGQNNPYQVVITNSGTSLGNDVEVVINLATVVAKEDAILCLKQIILSLESNDAAPLS
jgi:hypothetical protein